MAEYKDVEQLKKQIADFKRAVNSVKPMNSDYLTGYISALSVVEGAIAEQPTTDVAPVRHGRWECNKSIVQCDVCGFGLFPDGYFFENGECTHANEQNFRLNFCPNCGAKMDGGD